MSKLKILFVSHDATRTGAPIVLLHLLRWIKMHDKAEVSVLLLAGGELVGEFESVGDTYFLHHVFNTGSTIKNVSLRFYNKFISRIEPVSIPHELTAKKFDLVYINTIVGVPWVSKLKSIFKVPLLCHIHENKFTIDYYYPNLLTEENSSLIDRFIAVSESTKANLITNFNIAQDNVNVHYEFVPVSELNEPNVREEIIREELNLTDEFVVGGCGLTSWRKGIDLFIDLAVKINKLRPDNRIKLVWVGKEDHFFKSSYAYEVDRLNINDSIIFTGSKSDPFNYFQIFDIFSLTSREDPFPLVCLEAASLGKPIICFEGSGGIPELLHNGGGALVPYGDVEAMANMILNLYDNREALKSMSKTIQIQIIKYDVNCVAPEIFSLINSLVEEGA